MFYTLGLLSGAMIWVSLARGWRVALYGFTLLTIVCLAFSGHTGSCDDINCFGGIG